MGINFDPFPQIKTERLLLRKLTVADTSSIFTLRSDERIQQFIKRPLHSTKGESLEFIHFINAGIEQNEWIYWAISPIDGTELIGTICLWNFSKTHHKADIGYELHPDHQGKGLMNEAAISVIHYGFNDLNLQSIEAYTHFENEASKRLLRRNHFVLDPKRKDQENEDNVIFVLRNNSL